MFGEYHTDFSFELVPQQDRGNASVQSQVPSCGYRGYHIGHCATNIAIPKSYPCAESCDSHYFSNRSTMGGVCQGTVLMAHHPIAMLSLGAVMQLNHRFLCGGDHLFLVGGKGCFQGFFQVACGVWRERI